MKIMQLVLFLSSILFITATHAMEEVSMEQQLLEGTISTQDYLLYIEANPEMWGAYSEYLFFLRTANYTNSVHGNLYDRLIASLKDVVDINRIKIKLNKVLLNRGLNNPRYSLGECIEIIEESTIKFIKQNNQYLMQGVLDKTIGPLSEEV